MGPHDLQTQLLAVDFTYRTGPFRFPFIWSIYRNYLTAGGRTIPAKNRWSEIARCPSTDHTDADRALHSCEPRLTNRCIVRWLASAHPVTSNAIWMPGCGSCYCLTKTWPNKSCGARPVAYRYSDGLIFTTLHCSWSDSNPWRIWSSTFDTPAPIRHLESVTVPYGIRKVPVRLCTKMTKISVFTRDRRKPRERFVKAPLVQCTVYWWSQLEHHVICKSETVPVYSCVSVYVLLDDYVETLLVE